MAAADAVGNKLRHRRRFSGAVLAGVLGLAIALAGCGSSSGRTNRSTSEPAFATAFATVMPSLQTRSGTTAKAISNLRKNSDAQVATLFMGLSKQWSRSAKPLLALKAPAPVSNLFAAVTSHVPVVEADLVTLAQSAVVHDASTVALCAQHLTSNFHELRTAVAALEMKLGIDDKK